MKYTLNSNNNPSTDSQDCILIPIFCDDKDVILGEAGIQLDQTSNGEITAILNKGDFKANSSNTLMLYQINNVIASRVLLVGCGKSSEYDAKKVFEACQAAGKILKDTSIENISSYLTDSVSASQADTAITQSVIAFEDTYYQLQDYKSEKKDAPKLIGVSLSSSLGFNDDAQTALNNGISISQGMKLTRDLANHPGNVCTPSYIAEIATQLSESYKSIEIDILEEKDMEKLGMGSFLSVSKGSDEPGKMVILQYFGAGDKKQQPIALVGKGVTFDTGGISLKPGANMDEMKFDMGGAAGMLGTLKACAEMQLNINLVVVLAAAENMPSARASKPGDIVTSMKGITIEVLNTDAEGRLVLCDALTYVGKYNPSIVIDAATLTGACIIALGHHISAVLSNNDELAGDLMDAGNTINDRVWRLPMGEEYKKQLESSFADLGNIGGRAAGTITAACFLGEFTKDYKWAHLDIAGTAWTGKNATGRPVPLLSQFLINQANK